jgi:acetyltransferase
VRDLDELFTAAETLGRLKPFPGHRLAILGNGGVGTLAGDRLIDLGGTLAGLSPATLGALDKALPSCWSRINPVAMIGAAGPQVYAAAIAALLDDDANDAVLVINVPTALAFARDCAAAVVAAVAAHKTEFSRRKPVLAVWIAGEDDARGLFEVAGIPSFQTETDAVRGFMHLVAYSDAQRSLMEAPASLTGGLAKPRMKARAIVEAALAQDRRRLDPLEVSQVLEAYGIPVTPVIVAADAMAAGVAARPILATGRPAAVKILSPDIIHKSDIGGVALDLASEQAVIAASDAILAQARAVAPDARINGLVVQAMIRRPKARELIIGLADDPTFGPVILFGHGGTAAEVIDDTGLALPPLDLKLAHDLIERTHVSRLLKGYRDVPAVDLDAVAATLVKVSQLTADLPEICELDLNPILADASGLVVVDARIMLTPIDPRGAKGRGHPRFAIRPYPIEWERTLVLPSGRRFQVRPIRPEDDTLIRALLARVTPDDLRLRFFAHVKEFNPAFLARLTQLDYARSIAFIALDEASGEPCGVVRLHADANHETSEFAILLRSDLKGLGLGWALMELIIAWAKADGIGVVEGQVLRENKTMLAMCERLGFEVEADPADLDVKCVRLSISTS